MAEVDEHKHNLHRVARPSKRGQAESPSRKSQLEFVKIIIRLTWARGAMEERAYCASPPLPSSAIVEQKQPHSELQMKCEQEFLPRCVSVCVCVSLCVCVGQEHKEPQKCVF